MTHPCECPKTTTRSLVADVIGYLPEEEKARQHEAGACPGDYGMQLYERGGVQLWLCSCCNLSGDVLVHIDEEVSA